MSGSLMKVGVKSPSNTVVPVNEDVYGRVITNRSWKKVWETIEEGVEIRDTSEHTFPYVDVRDVPLYSLRFTNRLGVPITVELLTDVNTLNEYSLVDKNAQQITFTIQPTSSYTIITFNDIPELQYVQYLRFKVKASSAPESGTLSAYIVKVV